MQEKIAELESRIARIESFLQARFPATSPRPPVEIRPQNPLPQVEEEHELSLPPRRSHSLFAWVAGLCFIFAMVFLVKLAMDSGWLTPPRQVGLAAVFGFVLIGAGFALQNKDREFSAYLPAFGIAILYLAIYGSHLLYSLTSIEMSFAMVSAVTVLCLFLHSQFRYDLYLVACCLGTYAIPILINSRGTLLNLKFSYQLFWTVTFAILATRTKELRLALLTAYFALLSMAIWGMFEVPKADWMLLAGVQSLQFVIFLAATVGHSLKHEKPMSGSEAYSFLPLLLFFYGSQYYFISRVHPTWAPWISLGFGALVFAAYWFAKEMLKGTPLESQSVVETFVSIVVFHSLYFELCPDDFKPLFYFFLLGVIWLRPQLIQKTGRPAGAMGFIIGIVLLLEYVRILIRTIESHGDYAYGFMAFGAGLFLFTVMLGIAPQMKQNRGQISLILAAAHLQVMSGLYRLIENTGSLAVSAAWAVYSIVILALAQQKKDVEFAHSGGIIFFLSAAKVLIYDVSSTNSVVRILCLLLTGALFYGAGIFYRRVESWKRQE